MTENTKIINQKERKRMEIKSLHTHVDIVARSKGASVIAKAAYNARDKLQDEYYGKTHDYSKKQTLYSQKYSCRNISQKSFLIENTYGMKLKKSKKVKIHNLQEIYSSHFQDN